MISSKALLAKTGLSRATLNNYIGLGLLSKPTIRSGGDSGERLLGYFPDSALERIEAIRTLKAAGKSMPQIVRLLAEQDLADESGEEADEAAYAGSAELAAGVGAERRVASEVDASGVRSGSSRGDELRLSLDDVTHPAYMFNYRFEVTWHNDAARRELLGDFVRLPVDSDGRNLVALLGEGTTHWTEPVADELLRGNLALALARVSESGIRASVRALPTAMQQRVARLLEACPTVEPDRRAASVIPVQLPDARGRARDAHLVATYFREGVLVVCVPASESLGGLVDFLARRDVVIRHLLRNRLPVLTPLAVLVADLQGSTRICSELPPEEYFELINEIWSSMDPIFKRYFGTHGKHVGDGMVYYFFPQPESDYVLNALRCAQELRECMRQINSRWQLRKSWLNELYLNIGVHEGNEWLGTFQSSTSVEFAVLGDTINQAARLSELARFGAIWATKSLIGKLSAQDRARLSYGVSRRTREDREVFVESTFAQIDSLVDIGAVPKMRDVATLAVTELRGLRS